MKWKDVNDKLPTQFESYIVTDGSFVTIGYWDINEFVGCENDTLNPITHWMPFPQPPRNFKGES
jgi:hypothetical protein